MIRSLFEARSQLRGSQALPMIRGVHAVDDHTTHSQNTHITPTSQIGAALTLQDASAVQGGCCADCNSMSAPACSRPVTQAILQGCEARRPEALSTHGPVLGNALCRTRIPKRFEADVLQVHHIAVIRHRSYVIDHIMNVEHLQSPATSTAPVTDALHRHVRSRQAQIECVRAANVVSPGPRALCQRSATACTLAFESGPERR